MLIDITAPPLLDRLRRETSAYHQRLEDALDLLSPPFQRERFATLLERFYGFHAVFEPAAANCAQWGELVASRRKLPHLAVDLAWLGRDAGAVDSLARCHGASRLTRSPESLLGALYVLEGSALGGEVVSRALAAAEWPPSGGFAYFRPYGAGAGEMWRRFRAVAEAASTPDRDSQIVTGAQNTFRLLIQWLRPAFRPVA